MPGQCGVTLSLTQHYKHFARITATTNVAYIYTFSIDVIYHFVIMSKLLPEI